MLELTKKKLKEMPDKEFSSYFQEYVMKVQDRNIDTEMRYFSKMNSLTPIKVIQSMNSVVKEMKEC